MRKNMAEIARVVNAEKIAREEEVINRRRLNARKFIFGYINPIIADKALEGKTSAEFHAIPEAFDLDRIIELLVEQQGYDVCRIRNVMSEKSTSIRVSWL